jgi:transcriptional regulator GlxA family with amidase domain
VVARTGLSHRSLQRWAALHIGMPLRTYLRLLRFQSTLSDIQHGSESIGQAAATHGYADQAHMARSFRELAGQPPLLTRSRAVGPFLERDQAPPTDEPV